MKIFLEKVQENGPAGRKRSDRKSKRTRQKNERGDSKVESNDSPEIPDWGETSDGLPSGNKYIPECDFCAVCVAAVTAALLLILLFFCCCF